MTLRVVVLGTGTAIGKTHVVECLRVVRPSSVALKPVESGYSGEDPSSDQRRLGAAAPAPYLLARPVSPHLAARDAGVTLSLEVILDWVRARSSGLPDETPVLIETAGGAFSPLSERADNAALAQRLDPSALILVAPDRLGVLHDLRATIRGLRAFAPGLPRPVLALCSPEEADASTGTNLAEISLFEPHLRGVLFPRARPADSRSIEAATRLWSWLEEPPDQGGDLGSVASRPR